MEDKQFFQGGDRDYFLGLGLGLIPVIIFWIAVGAPSSAAGIIAAVGGVLTSALLIAMIVCLINRRLRRLGYGLLTMVLVSPIVFAIGCTIVVTRG